MIGRPEDEAEKTPTCRCCSDSDKDDDRDAESWEESIDDHANRKDEPEFVPRNKLYETVCKRQEDALSEVSSFPLCSFRDFTSLLAR